MNRSKTQQFNNCPKSQNGVALVITLILMVMITIIGVASLRTTSLEEKMAANIQQSTRAFESAESGIRQATTDVDNFSVYNDAQNPVIPSASPFTFPPNPSSASAITGTADIEVGFEGWSVPKRGAGYSVVHFKTANFGILAKGAAAGNAKAEIRQGLGQIVNKE